MGNNYGINWNQAGFCGKCFSPIAEFEGSDKFGRPKVKKLVGAYRAEFVLDSGSKMGCCLCETCYINLKPEDTQSIMEAVINGWQKQIDCSDMKDQDKLNYMDYFSKRNITQCSHKPFEADDLNKVKQVDSKNLNIKVSK